MYVRMYVRMYVCMYVFMYVCMYVLMYIKYCYGTERLLVVYCDVLFHTELSDVQNLNQTVFCNMMVIMVMGYIHTYVCVKYTCV